MSTKADEIRARVEAVMNGTFEHDLDEQWVCRHCGAQLYMFDPVGEPVWDPPCRCGGTPMRINDACIHKPQWPVFACDICMRAYSTGEWPSEMEMEAIRTVQAQTFMEVSA